MKIWYALGRLAGMLLPKRATRSRALSAAPLKLRGDDLVEMFKRPGGFEHYQATEAARRAAGMVDGEHYTALAPEIQRQLAAKEWDAAAGLLHRAVDAVEREAHYPSLDGPPAWFHMRLAALYQRTGRADLARVIRKRLDAIRF